MREIVSLLVGGCGNRVGTNFWRRVMGEHCIDPNNGQQQCASNSNNNNNMNSNKDGGICSDENTTVFLDEKDDRCHHTYFPRVVMTDLEDGTINAIRSSEKLVRPEFITHGQCGSNFNNFGKGIYTDGAELIESILDQIRKSVEGCDSCEGFQMFHSLMGGSGSGLGSLIISKVRDDYTDKIVATTTVFPSHEDYFGVKALSVYNSVLSMHYLVQNCDFCSLYDNQAMDTICNQNLNFKDNNFEGTNNLISQSLCGITSSFRFGGILYSGYRKLSTNLTPFPRLHFFAISHSPFNTPDTESTIERLTRDLFEESNFLLSLKPNDGGYMTNSITYRGEISNISLVENCVGTFKKENTSLFKEWIPNNIHTSLCKVPELHNGSKNSATMVSNTSAIQTVYKKLSESFTDIFKRKDLLCFYTGEGMYEMEFTEAESNLNDLISEYYDHWGASYSSEEDFEEDMED